jgi:ParB/RepB/Spo0J family partition protein
MENQQNIDVSLSIIKPSTSNKLFRPEAKLTREALSEMIATVQVHGVIQPIAIRPDPAKEGYFILIAGERRYHASIYAGKETIPAKIWYVTEEVALQMQMAENLHREDIHSMNEAKAYKLMLDTNGAMTTNELALQAGKSETYIVQRLKLNDLIREAEKDFLADKMLLGHALLLCRLTAEDQKLALKEMKRYRNEFGTVRELQAFIERNIINDLSNAPFNKKDPTLCLKAGACTMCPKRSGASLLFADIKGKDKCFDPACYTEKSNLHLTNEMKRIVETEPETLLLTSRSSVPNDSIAAIIADQKIKPLVEYDDFNTYKSDNAKKIKGFWICGHNAGQTETVYVRQNAEKKIQPDSPEIVRKTIIDRMKRYRELDQEKVYAKILTSLQQHPTQKKPGTIKMVKEEEILLWYIIFDKAGYSLSRELAKQLHIPIDSPDKIGEAIAKLKSEDRTYILRRVMMEQYGGNYPRSAYGVIIQKIAASYGDIAIQDFENEQKAICEKREMKAKERLKALRVLDDKEKKKAKAKKTKHENVLA